MNIRDFTSKQSEPRFCRWSDFGMPEDYKEEPVAPVNGRKYIWPRTIDPATGRPAAMAFRNGEMRARGADISDRTDTDEPLPEAPNAEW